MKTLAVIVSLALFATTSVSFSTPSVSKEAAKGKKNASQTTGAKQTSNPKKPPCSPSPDRACY